MQPPQMIGVAVASPVLRGVRVDMCEMCLRDPVRQNTSDSNIVPDTFSLNLSLQRNQRANRADARRAVPAIRSTADPIITQNRTNPTMPIRSHNHSMLLCGI